MRVQSEMPDVIKAAQGDGKTVGLVVGCFDMLHIGHVELFQFAKQHVDILVVGIEQDETIKLAKGNDRPMHTLADRAQVLLALKDVDEVYSIDGEYDVYSNEGRKIHRKMLYSLHPDYLITNPIADTFWSAKKKDASEANVVLLLLQQERRTSSSKIIEVITSTRV